MDNQTKIVYARLLAEEYGWLVEMARGDRRTLAGMIRELVVEGWERRAATEKARIAEGAEAVSDAR